MAKKEHIIFCNGTFSDITEEERRNEYKSWLMDCQDMTEEEAEVQKEEDSFYTWEQEEESFWFDAERDNLDIELDDNILAIADLGLWNGRRSGYKELRRNVNQILQSFGCDYIKVYTEGREVKHIGVHHDGTNKVWFRTWKAGTSEVAKDRVKEAIYNGVSNAEKLVRKHTRSIYKDIAKVYGW